MDRIGENQHDRPRHEKPHWRNQQQPVENEHALVIKFRKELLTRGASGLKSFGQFFRHANKEGKEEMTLTISEFQNAVLAYNLKISATECNELFAMFDSNLSGNLDFNEFLEHVRPPMNKNRLALINQAFEKLDKNKNGQITIDDLQHVYNVKNSPKFLSGEKTEEQLLKTFLDTFDSDSHKNGVVTYEEFVHYYAAVSASIDNDPYFDMMMRHAWKI